MRFLVLKNVNECRTCVQLDIESMRIRFRKLGLKLTEDDIEGLKIPMKRVSYPNSGKTAMKTIPNVPKLI